MRYECNLQIGRHHQLPEILILREQGEVWSHYFMYYLQLSARGFVHRIGRSRSHACGNSRGNLSNYKLCRRIFFFINFDYLCGAGDVRGTFPGLSIKTHFIEILTNVHTNINIHVKLSMNYLVCLVMDCGARSHTWQAWGYSLILPGWPAKPSSGT